MSHTLWCCRYHIVWTPKYRYRILKGEVKHYDDYVQGNVYGYNIENNESGEILDSCGGYIGLDYYDDMVKEAQHIIDHEIKALEKTISTCIVLG